MKLLALDTFSARLQVALQVDNELIVHCEESPRMHAALILPLIDKCLVEADVTLDQLDAIAFGRGPGSFTGLRIASSVTQALAHVHSLPVRPVSNLQALAQTTYRRHGKGKVCSLLDARMSEVYMGCFELADGLMRPVDNEAVLPPEAVTLPNSNWSVAGDGWQAYESAYLMSPENIDGVFADIYPEITDLMLLAHHTDNQSALSATPVYLRNRVAWRKENG